MRYIESKEVVMRICVECAIAGKTKQAYAHARYLSREGIPVAGNLCVTHVVQIQQESRLRTSRAYTRKDLAA